MDRQTVTTIAAALITVTLMAALGIYCFDLATGETLWVATGILYTGCAFIASSITDLLFKTFN